MRIIKLHWQQWRTLALKFKPHANFNNIMEHKYGLVRTFDNNGINTFEYKVVDEQKYIIYLLEWS
jgi:hypothetical protein